MFDVIIVGAGVGGSALAYALGQAGRRVLVIERDFRPPQLFVGELLQPGGVAALAQLGLRHCIEGIDAQRVEGFAVVTPEGTGQSLPYPTINGYAFHHCRFVDQLRQAARSHPNVTSEEGTVVGFVEESGRVVGVRYRNTTSADDKIAKAYLTVACDGRHSKLRTLAMPAQKPEEMSHSVGLLLQGTQLPYAAYGNLFFVRPAPVLAYPIASGDVRLLVDVPGPLPSIRDGALAQYLIDTLLPQLPQSLHAPFMTTIETDRLRVMPTYRLTPNPQHRDGIVFLGDALNMRHPLTGSGMTVALNDVVLLSQQLATDSLSDEKQLRVRIATYYKLRRPMSMTVDMLSGALYEIFRGESVGLDRMRQAVLNYWQLGGIAVRGPMTLLSGVDPSAWRLLAHYMAVATIGVGTELSQKPWYASWRSATKLVTAATKTMAPQVMRAMGPYLQLKGRDKKEIQWP